MTLHVGVSGWLLGPPSGANRRLLALLGELGALLAPDERITVLHRPDWSPPPLPRIGWCPIEIAAGPTLRRVLGESRCVARTLQRLGVHVFDHGFLPLPDVPMQSCLLLHDLRAVDGFSRWPRWLARHALRNSAARAGAIVVPSAFTAARVRAVLGETTPVHIVPNGVDLPNLAPAPAPRGHLLHTGHLEPRKNLAVLLRALALLPPGERPPLELVGHDAGAGRALRALASRLRLGDAVHFRGRLPDAEVAVLYAAARAIVVPSFYEGFGLCALEGLAHGRPVLVAAAGALPEVVGPAGIPLPPDDPAAWARAIAATATDPPGAIPARRARAAQFAWPAAATRLLAVWRDLAAQ